MLKIKISIIIFLSFIFLAGAAQAVTRIDVGPPVPSANAPLFLDREGGSQIGGQLDIVAGQSLYQAGRDVTPQEAVFQIIRYALGFVGTVFVVIILYGGFLWMTAGGNEDKLSKAKKFLVNGAIGAGIVFASLSIWIFVIERLYIASTESIGERADQDCVQACSGASNEGECFSDCLEEKYRSEYPY